MSPLPRSTTKEKKPTATKSPTSKSPTLKSPTHIHQTRLLVRKSSVPTRVTRSTDSKTKTDWNIRVEYKPATTMTTRGTGQQKKTVLDKKDDNTNETGASTKKEEREIVARRKETPVRSRKEDSHVDELTPSDAKKMSVSVTRHKRKEGDSDDDDDDNKVEVPTAKKKKVFGKRSSTYELPQDEDDIDLTNRNVEKEESTSRQVSRKRGSSTYDLPQDDEDDGDQSGNNAKKPAVSSKRVVRGGSSTYKQQNEGENEDKRSAMKARTTALLSKYASATKKDDKSDTDYEKESSEEEDDEIDEYDKFLKEQHNDKKKTPTKSPRIRNTTSPITPDDKTKTEKYAQWIKSNAASLNYGTEQTNVHVYVANNLFSKVKFIVDDSELDYTGENCIAHVVCKGANIPKHRWNDFRDAVRKKLRIQRNSACSALKKAYMAVLLEDGISNVPSINDILKLRKLENGEVNEAFLYFSRYLLPSVVGLNKIKRGGDLPALGEISTPSDEALALVVLENNEQKWLDEFENDKKKTGNSESKDVTKYTTGGFRKNKKGYTIKNSGWSVEGIERFNEILDMIRDDRKQNREFFEKEWLEYLVERGGRQEIAEEPTDDVSSHKRKFLKAGNDLFDDVTDDEETHQNSKAACVTVDNGSVDNSDDTHES